MSDDKTTLKTIEAQIRALHYYGNPPDARLQEDVDCDVAGILEDVRDLLRASRAEVERLHDALDWLVHLHYGMSKGGNNCPITDEEWNDAIKQGRMALDEYDRQRAQPGELKK